MKARHKRLIGVSIGVIALGGAATLALDALRSNISYFFSPSQILAGAAPQTQVFRLGGLVEKGSLHRSGNDLTARFTVTDLAQQITVSYTGILPDLFKEGQGVVARGRLGADGVFYAEEVLAKHDEAYMPPEVKSSLKTAGVNSTAQKEGNTQ